MKVYDQDNTVAAIATPPGEGGIGIIRISGPSSFRILTKIFKPKSNPDQIKSHRLYFGEIIDPSNNYIVDEAIFSYMKAPNSYTREDVVEINCHGGYVVLQKTLEIVLREGAREAGPGEFTKRAFLNGRIDLSQAEAVIDVIRSKTEAALESAAAQLKGMLKKEVETLKDELAYSLALIETYIDFPEEDIEPESMEQIKGRLFNASKKLQDLIDSYDEGRILRDGIYVVIAGVPNVGKSSLMNALLMEKRVIVTSVPGTTRDTIEEVVNINGIPVNLIDTAGIRDTEDIVESEGIKKTIEKLNKSDMVLYMLDERGVKHKDLEILRSIKNKKVIVIINKVDLLEVNKIKNITSELNGYICVAVSAVSGSGLDKLKDLIHSTILVKKTGTENNKVISRKRHKIAMERAVLSIERAMNGMEKGLSVELISIDIKDAIDKIGEIVGETTPDHILDLIFNEFCIGK